MNDLYIYGLNCKSQPGKDTTHKKLQAYTLYERRYKKNFAIMFAN